MQRALAGASHSPRREERCELHQQRAAPLEVAAVAGLVAAAAGGRGGAPSAEHRPGAALDALRHGSVAPQRSSPWPRLQGCSLANHLSLCLLNKASQGLRSDLFRPLRRASRQCVMPKGLQERGVTAVEGGGSGGLASVRRGGRACTSASASRAAHARCRRCSRPCPSSPLLASAVIGEPYRQGAHRAMAFDSQEVKAGQCKVLQFGQHE